MRGRTNVTQRPGPVVIGNLVTRKQVTGGRINMGDFVEFTGDTSTWENISGPFNYQYSKSFKIMEINEGNTVIDVIFGVFYINATNSQCRLMVCNKDGIKRITNLSGISFEGVDPYPKDVYIDENTLYVTFNAAATYTRTIDGKVYVFNYNSSNYSITYNRTISVTLPTYSGSNKYYLIGVRDNYIYGYARNNSSSSNHHILRMNINGSTTVNDYSFTSADFASYTNRIYNVLISDNYIFFFGSDSDYDRIIFNYSDSSLVIQSVSSSDQNGTQYCANGALVKHGDYFYLVGRRPNNDAGICVFYLDSNMNVHVIDVLYLSSDGTAIPFAILVEGGNDNDYRIIACYCGSGHLSCYLINFNSNNSKITLYERKLLYINGIPLTFCETLMLFDASNIYNVFFTRSTGSVLNNYLGRTKFVVNNNQIVQAESLDLVKPYANTINGVAKTGGNIGQEISIYIP